MGERRLEQHDRRDRPRPGEPLLGERPGGVEVDGSTATGNAILGNSIYANGGLGIDLNRNPTSFPNGDGVTPNDLGDTDSGPNAPNALQNFPVLTSAATASATQITIAGSLNSSAGHSYRIEFFANSPTDPSEGQLYLGFVNVNTDGAGNAALSATLTAGLSLAVGQFVTATATDLTTFDTSEFSAPIPANRAPTLDAGKSPALTAGLEDAGAPVGAVGTLVSSLVDFAVPAGQVDNVTDPDTSALLGIALTATDTTRGSWFYSTNGGTTWTAVGAVSNTSALLLAANANTRLYFQPNPNWNGALAAAITFRAWDQTTGTAESQVDTSVNGGTSAFSTATDTASLTVTGVNDPPVATNLSAPETYTEDTPLNLTDIVVSDLDSANVTVSLTLSNPAAGALNSATAGSVTSSFTAGVWTAAGNIADVNTLLAGLTFTPAANYNSTFTLATSVSDGIAPALTGTKTMTSIPVNDPPVATNCPPPRPTPRTPAQPHRHRGERPR